MKWHQNHQKNKGGDRRCVMDNRNRIQTEITSNDIPIYIFSTYIVVIAFEAQFELF